MTPLIIFRTEPFTNFLYRSLWKVLAPSAVITSLIAGPAVFTEADIKGHLLADEARLAKAQAIPLTGQQVSTILPERCTLEGLVVNAETGEPLKTAWFTLRKAESRKRSITITTDSSGRFVLKNIEPGGYRLSVERDGYVPQEYGERGHIHKGRILTLEPGQHVRDLVFRLIPTGALSGRVYNEDREPLLGVRVQALRYSYFRGQRELVLSGGAVTNDLGEYRLYGLAPGRYYILAYPKLRHSRLGLGGTATPGSTSVSVTEEGYAPTFYPGTSSPGSAAPLELRTSADMRGIDFTLVPAHQVNLRGRVFDALSNRPVPGARLRLAPRESGMQGVLFHKQTVTDNPKGSFEFRNVTAGTYVLSANWSDKNEKAYSARQTLSVGTSDMDGVDLVIAPGVDVPGRVRVEDNVQVKVTNLRVLSRPRDETMAPGVTASVEADGTFVLRNVLAGDYDLSLSGLPTNSYLKSARLGSDEVLDAGFSPPSGLPLGSLELTISPSGGRIKGVVQAEQGKPFDGALVALIPEPTRRRQDRLYRTTITDEYGGFNLQGIPPGDYKLFAWEDVEVSAYQDPDFLRAYEARGESLHVVGAGQYSVELKLILAEEPPK